MDARTVAIDPKNLESGIEALSSAAQAFRLTRFERGAYYLLKVSVDVTVWTWIVGFALFFLETVTGIRPEDVGFIMGGVLVFGTIIAAIALVVNIPLAAKLYRERARLKELGLASLSKSLWKEVRRGRWISQVARWGPIITLVIIFTVMFVFVFSDPAREWEPKDTLVVVFFMIFAAVLVLARYLRNQRERMGLATSAEELKNVFQGLQQRARKAEVVSVPSELLEQAARIESAQIAKERKDAILQSVSVGPSGYAVTFDGAAAEQRRMLDVSDRVELEDRVAQLSIEGPDKLTSQPGPPEGATRRCETKSKRVEIEYVVDQASHGIRIIAVQSGSHSSPERT
jgi:hypothetical protein